MSCSHWWTRSPRVESGAPQQRPRLSDDRDALEQARIEKLAIAEMGELLQLLPGHRFPAGGGGREDGSHHRSRRRTGDAVKRGAGIEER